MAFAHIPRSPRRGVCTRSSATTERTLGNDEHPCTRSSGDTVARTSEDVECTVSNETTDTAELLRSALEELRNMKEDRLRLQQREKELCERLQLAQQGQSFTNFNSDLVIENNIGFKLKPDIYDGSAPLREFLTQFRLLSRVNNWSDSVKVAVLASSLRGKARSVLDGISELENLQFSELESRLELRFGENHLTQSFYTQFINRKQRFGEDIPTLGADIERLSRLVYPECSAIVQDKIACSQFITAISDSFIKRTLQLEGIISLRAAMERAMAIKVIKENSFSRFPEKSKFLQKSSVEKDSFNKFSKTRNFKEKEKFSRKNIECWQCGSKGHFRSECPSLSLPGKQGNAE
jgi:hypothetical protein